MRLNTFVKNLDNGCSRFFQQMEVIKEVVYHFQISNCRPAPAETRFDLYNKVEEDQQELIGNNDDDVFIVEGRLNGAKVLVGGVVTVLYDEDYMSLDRQFEGWWVEV